jgi:hypothetical protein
MTALRGSTCLFIQTKPKISAIPLERRKEMMSLSDIIIKKHVCKPSVDKQVASDSSVSVRGLTLSDLIQYAQRAKDAGEFVDLILRAQAD